MEISFVCNIETKFPMWRTYCCLVCILETLDLSFITLWVKENENTEFLDSIRYVDAEIAFFGVLEINVEDMKLKEMFVTTQWRFCKLAATLPPPKAFYIRGRWQGVMQWRESTWDFVEQWHWGDSKRLKCKKRTASGDLRQLWRRQEVCRTCCSIQGQNLWF